MKHTVPTDFDTYKSILNITAYTIKNKINFISKMCVSVSISYDVLKHCIIYFNGSSVYIFKH